MGDGSFGRGRFYKRFSFIDHKVDIYVVLSRVNCQQSDIIFPSFVGAQYMLHSHYSSGLMSNKPKRSHLNVEVRLCSGNLETAIKWAFSEIILVAV